MTLTELKYIVAVARTTIEPGDAIHDGTQSIIVQESVPSGHEVCSLANRSCDVPKINREAQPNVLSIV